MRLKNALYFVYGTLKRGFCNHHYLEKAAFQGATMTARADWDMIEIPSTHAPGKTCPGVLPEGHYHIAGEVYEVDDAMLEKIDELENYKVQYDRKLIPLDNGMSAYIYFNIDPAFDAGTRGVYIEVDEAGNTLGWRAS